MSNYKIINNEELLKSFIDTLQDCKSNERYHISLFARKKYSVGLKKTIVLRTVFCTKDKIFNEIEKFEVKLGVYKYNNTPIDNDALVVYIDLAPKCMDKALLKCNIAIAKSLFNGNKTNYTTLVNAAFVKSNTKRQLVHFDIDDKELTIKDLRSRLYKYINKDSCIIVRTMNGYHLLVKGSEAPVKINGKLNNGTWFKSITNEFNVDKTGSMGLPIPGTLQGGFKVKIESIN